MHDWIIFVSGLLLLINGAVFLAARNGALILGVLSVLFGSLLLFDLVIG